MTALLIVIAVVVLLGLWGVGIYNNLVKLRNNRENAFANIDVQLKQATLPMKRKCSRK